MIGAIVLAAGSSTRMDLDPATGAVATKALLPLGSRSALERVVHAVQEAGITDVVVVTGHGAGEVSPVAEALEARPVYNAGYLRGMFSSVQTGVAALGPEVEAFFVLPVDCALVGSTVLAALLDAHLRASETAAPLPVPILYPTCCGRRGHPPLLPARLRDEILGDEGPDGLRGVLLRHEAESVEVEVFDLTVLMDMDAPDDYGRLARIAERRLSGDDCRYLRSLLRPPELLVRHTEMVTAVATVLATALEPHIPGLDVDLVRCACLVHDLAKRERKHAAVAQRLLENLGLFRIGAVAGAHMVIPPEKLAPVIPNEEQLVYLADKLVVDDRVVGFDEKMARTLERQHLDGEALQGAEARIDAARTIARRVETLLGHPLEDVILELRAGAPDE